MIIIRLMKDYSIILNRLKKNLVKRKTLLKQNITAYRLYEKDIPEYPYIIDIYNDFAVVYEKGKRVKEDNHLLKLKFLKHKEQVKEALIELLKIESDNIIFKERSQQKGKSQYEKLSKSNEYINISEEKLKFRVNLYDYLDTGLFLDHRPLRKRLVSMCKDKTVLNLFSYTGSLSVAASFAGAKKVTTVDLSKNYIQWAQENFKTNNLDTQKNEFLVKDCLNYIYNELNTKFDVIILDPPSFSNSKKMKDTFDIQSSHMEMILKLMKHLNKDGILFFSNNLRTFKIDSRLQNLFNIKDISKKSIPMDFRDDKIHFCFEITHKNDD